MNDLLSETIQIMKKYNIKANKKLGQNFLIDEDVLDAIVEASDIQKDDLVIEIGSGLGALTNKLVGLAGKVICIELDDKMVEVLKDRFQNVEIINQDVLKTDINQIISRYSFKNVKIVANLPYYITTPIIMKLLEDKLDIQSITVMVQKEVAKRLVEVPGGKETGAITYSVHYYAKPEFILEVPKESFLPSPEVISAIIKLEILKEPPVVLQNEKLFFKLLKVVFAGRRKTLLNAITNANLLDSKEEVENMLKELNIPSEIRGERLILQQFADIANYIQKREE